MSSKNNTLKNPEQSLPVKSRISTIKREIPELNYYIVEGNLKHLQGQILTLIEALMDEPRRTSTKSLVKGYFNDRLTFLFDLYGADVGAEMPDYSNTTHTIE